jgi:hypothetical protein
MKILNVGDVVYCYNNTNINRHKVVRVTKTQAILEGSFTRLKRDCSNYLQTIPKQRMWDTWSWALATEELDKRYEKKRL